MTMTPQQLWDAAITLKNDGEFYKEYTNFASADTPSANGRRTIICWAASRLRIICDAEDREQLRRYLDDTWQLPPARHGISPIQQARATLDTIEFWKDEVRFPKKGVAAPAAAQLPQPGSVWWKHANWQGCNPPNHGEFYTDDEVKRMVRMFYNCCDAPTIAYELKRKHNSIAAKLKELRLLSFKSETNTWHVAPNLGPIESFSAFQQPQPSDITADPCLYEFPKPTHLSEQSLAAINPKETIMTAPTIEITTKTLINGQDISAMSDSVIYSTIANQEAEIEKLEKIKNKPKRLVAEIEKRQAGIKALVDFLDGKESKTA